MNAYKDIGNKVLIALAGINRDSTIDNDGYKYDASYFHIDKRFLEFSWSKSLIKQLLVYIACSDSVGEIHYISEIELAEKIGVSVRTVQHNNYLLQKQDILSWERIVSDMIHVVFNHYKFDISGFEEIEISNQKNGQNKKHSTGYTKISKKTIDMLTKEEDVNVIRTTLRLFAMTEVQFNGIKQLPEMNVFYKDLTNFLPTYVGYKSKIKEICDEVTKYIPVKVIEGASSVKTFMQKRVLSNNMLRKAKDKLIYLIERDTYSSDEDAFKKETEAFLGSYQAILKVAKFEKLLPKDEDQLAIYRDDAGTLVSSFGLDVLNVALKKLYDIMHCYDKFKRSPHTETLKSKDFTYLSSFYYNPSMGIRYLASEL